MANTYVSVPTEAVISSISTALSTKYGANYTEYYKTTQYLVFSCTSVLQSKVIKFSYSTSKFQFYYGDAWTSDSTITNQVLFSGDNNSSFATSAIHMILGDSYIMFNNLASQITSQLVIIGTLTNGNEIALGYCAVGTGATYDDDQLGINITTADSLSIAGILDTMQTPDGKLFKFPIALYTTGSRFALMTESGEMATLPGLYICSFTTSTSQIIVTPSAFFSTSNMFHTSGAAELRTCLFAEF